MSTTAPDTLPAERTALAWRRTALTIAAGGLAGARLLEPLVGPVAVVLAAAGVSAATTLGVAAQRRWRRSHRATTHHERFVPLTDGRLTALAAAGTVALGLAAVLFLAASF